MSDSPAVTPGLQSAFTRLRQPPASRGLSGQSSRGRRFRIGYSAHMTVLGLDIGGANLKAATADKRAVSVPFALWKQPDKLPVALAELVAKFPDATEMAVTMTGELCDCFETKRDGVHAIIAATRFAS